MRSNPLLSAGIVMGASAAVLYPQWVWFSDATFPATSSIQPAQAWGLLVFSIMWLHIVAGPFRKQLDALFPNYQRWITISALVVFFGLFAHPLLMLTGFAKLSGGSFFSFFATATFPAWAAVIAWPLFLQYDIARFFKRPLSRARARYWITLLATIPWFLILYHSLALGSHLQTGPLRTLWIFMGLTAATATIYVFAIVPLRRR